MSYPGFKLAIWLDEMKLPFDEGLATAKRIGAEYVWFSELPGETPIASMSDAQVDEMGERVARHGLKLFQICAANPFHYIRLADLEPETFQTDPNFRKDFDALVRSMQIARRLGVRAVLAYGLSWPGAIGRGHNHRLGRCGGRHEAASSPMTTWTSLSPYSPACWNRRKRMMSTLSWV